jgi:uncharacterized radical SAM superfamily Fe-S cluster-containing enzyme
MTISPSIKLTEEQIEAIAGPSPVDQYTKIIKMVKEQTRKEFPDFTEKEVLIATGAVFSAATNCLAIEVSVAVDTDTALSFLMANMSTTNKCVRIIEKATQKASQELSEEQFTAENKPYDEGEDFRS